jgi:multiple sugar transport system permease protein
MSKTVRRLAGGLGFLSPNLLGFLVFTLVPLVISFLMAFTNWDIRRHNMFTAESIQYVGLGNFRRLFAEPDFLQYFGNTLFFMLGIPISMAGSLGAALLLNRDLGSGHQGAGRHGVWAWVLCTAVLTGALTLLVALGCGATATLLCLLSLAVTILIGGSAGGSTVYRSIFYSPSFTAGVATMLLWKKMYSPHTGPVNGVLAPVLTRLEGAVNSVPPGWVQAGSILGAAAVAYLLGRSAFRLARAWRDGEAGAVSIGVAVALLVAPVVLAPAWSPTWASSAIVVGAGLLAAGYLALQVARGRRYHCTIDSGLAITAIPAGVVAALACALLGMSYVAYHLPTMCQAGLKPPDWLGAYHWAKPALMIMGFWASIGSGNMLMYLAGLSNISPELYEAADIDGASSSQRFWHITWPQLAPVTFFIFVMSVIGGLQGGFETARTMTNGGPAGSTTTISYFIYNEGFVTGRLGYASAASWALFLLVFVVTLFNWRFGNKYTGE